MSRSLEVGDTIVVHEDRKSREPYTIHKVTKVTKTQITLDDGRRFLKSSKYQVGIGQRWDALVQPHLARDFFSGEWMTEADALETNRLWSEKNRVSIRRRLLKEIDWRHVNSEAIDILYSVAVAHGVIRV